MQQNQRQQQVMIPEQNQTVFQDISNMQSDHSGPLMPQHLTPQQQQMYQQHMQLQHQAQHLKKIRRSLPHSTPNSDQPQQQSLQQIRQQVIVKKA